MRLHLNCPSCCCWCSSAQFSIQQDGKSYFWLLGLISLSLLSLLIFSYTLSISLSFPFLPSLLSFSFSFSHKFSLILFHSQYCGRGSSVGKGFRRCNWTDVSLIPGCGIGGRKYPIHGAVVVAQLEEGSLPTPEIRGSNPDIGKVLSTNC